MDNKSIIYDINEILHNLNRSKSLPQSALFDIKKRLKEITPEQCVGEKIFYIYTDGCCINNIKKGGCGIYIVDLEGTEVKLKYNDLDEKKENISNNKYELYAVYKAFDYVLKNYDLKGTLIYWICDSMYTINCLTKWFIQWKRTDFKTAKGDPIKNEVLIKSAKELMIKLELNKNTIVPQHVPSHSKTKSKWNKGNEIADSLAREASSL